MTRRDESDGDEITRRAVLSNSARAGALITGGIATTGAVTAKGGGTGFVGVALRIDRGDRFSVVHPVTTQETIVAECEAAGRLRAIYTKYRIDGPRTVSGYLWSKGQATLAVGDEFVVKQVRDCGRVRVPRRYHPSFASFDAETVTFVPARA